MGIVWGFFFNLKSLWSHWQKNINIQPVKLDFDIFISEMIPYKDGEYKGDRSNIQFAVSHLSSNQERTIQINNRFRVTSSLVSWTQIGDIMDPWSSLFLLWWG